MKKTLIALFAVLVIGSATFAQNHHYGLDIQFGIPIATTKLTMEDSGWDDFATKIFEGGLGIHLATYDCFALKNMLGIYAAVGMNASFVAAGEDSAFDGDFYFGISGDFMIGPAFGVDLGSTRFQIGLPFHAVLARAAFDGEIVKYHACGFGLTPQFRFAADRRVSFIMGCDFTFDFPKKLKYESTYDDDYDDYDDEEEYDKGFRFGVRPYIGIGINFGN